MLLIYMKKMKMESTQNVLRQCFAQLEAQLQEAEHIN